MSNNNNLAKYKIFLSVAEYQSISKAAQQLYISQPAVSITIKKLEEDLHTTLFIRKPKGVSLTENGAMLYDNVKQAFNLLAATEQLIKSTKKMRRLRIAASNVLCKYFLMPYLQKFTQQYPDCDLTINCTSSANACRLIEKCAIDLALVAKPNILGQAKYTPLCTIEYAFVCSPAYRNKFSCSDDDIFNYANIMLLNKHNGSRDHVDNYYAKNNIIPAHILSVNDMDMLIEFAKIGIGISCVVRQFVEADLNRSDLIELKLSKPISPREIGFLYNQIQPFNEYILKFININLP